MCFRHACSSVNSTGRRRDEAGTRATRRIARWRQMGVTRILPELLREFGDLPSQRRHLRHQRSNLRLELDDPRVLRRDGGFELGDPVLRVQRPT